MPICFGEDISLFWLDLLLVTVVFLNAVQFGFLCPDLSTVSPSSVP